MKMGEEEGGRGCEEKIKLVEDEGRREREKRSGEEGGEDGGEGEEQPASRTNSWSTPGGRWNTARVNSKGY